MPSNVPEAYARHMAEQVSRVVDTHITSALRDVAAFGTGMVRVEPNPLLDRLREHGRVHQIEWRLSQRMDRPDLWMCWQLTGNRRGADISYLFDRVPTIEELDRVLEQSVQAFNRREQAVYGRSPMEHPAVRRASRELVGALRLPDDGLVFPVLDLPSLDLRPGAVTRASRTPRAFRGRRHPDNPALRLEDAPCT